MRRALVLLPAALAVACSSSSEPASQKYGYLNPGPGNQVDIGFYSQPPNDTPATATPLGTSISDDVTVWVVQNAIGGPGNAANYFVFRSGPGAGTFAFDGCYQPPITGMTATLWKVENGAYLEPPVATWSSVPDGDAGPGCLNDESAPLEASTVYLYGLVAQGGAGYYAL